MAFCERKVSANWWFRTNSKKYFSLLRVYCDWAFPSYKNSAKREAINISRRLPLQELVVRLNYALQYDIQHYTHQLLNGPSNTKSFIFWVLQNIGKEYCTKKLNSNKKKTFQSVSVKLSTTWSRNHELQRDVCFLCYSLHLITINHTDPNSLVLSRSERGPEFKTSSF